MKIRVEIEAWAITQVYNGIAILFCFMVLFSLAEIPECRMQIASSKSILKQLVATLMTPIYNSIASLVAMAGMLCLAYR